MLAAVLCSASTFGDDGGKTVSLFNGKDLDGWYTFTQHADKSADPYADPKGVFKVNGVVVNKGTKASVARGEIILQSEGAEVFYRDITIALLKK